MAGKEGAVMASFFVGGGAAASHAVHDRIFCPSACFAPPAAAEYLGEFADAAQAAAVARLRYGAVGRCAFCDSAWPWPAPLTPQRPLSPPRP
jgi:hypothetical protein